MPLHLAVFSRLAPSSQREAHRTLADLYERFTLVEWSLCPGLAGLAVELTERGDLDDIRVPLVSNGDFWMLVHGLCEDDPTAAARLIDQIMKVGVEEAAVATASTPTFSIKFACGRGRHEIYPRTDARAYRPGRLSDGIRVRAW